MEGLNKCSCCRKIKPTDEFQNESRRCQPCQTKITENEVKRYERRKQWQRDNPDKVKENSKKYWETHREEIRERRKEYRQVEVDCEICNCKVRKCRLSTHLKTEKHKNNEEQKRKEEEKQSKMTPEELDEYIKIQKLKKIWNKVKTLAYS